jgi:hypothetical protein
MKQESKSLARLNILNHIVTFFTMKYFGGNTYSIGMKEHTFYTCSHNLSSNSNEIKEYPPIGSLCMISAAPTSIYYLSWLKDIKIGSSGCFDTEYLLESIEDGNKSCWWSNVGIYYIPLETINKYPEWKWNDKQYQFKDRWYRCKKRRDEYQVLPYVPIFNDDDLSVVLRTRIKWSDINNSFTEKTFDNYKKVSLKDMLEFYDYSIKLYKDKK